MRSKLKWIFTLLIALTMQFSFAQEKTVTGTVSDQSGPLPGANVVVQGSKTGTQTDVDGKYSIKAKAGAVLVFSFVGMNETTVKVGASNTINVKMQDKAKELDGVIVQGYGKTATKANSTTASTTVGGESLENRPNVSVLASLQGTAPGLTIISSSGSPGSAKFDGFIRGASSINGNTDPLIVIDGIPSTSNQFKLKR